MIRLTKLMKSNVPIKIYQKVVFHDVPIHVSKLTYIDIEYIYKAFNNVSNEENVFTFVYNESKRMINKESQESTPILKKVRRSFGSGNGDKLKMEEILEILDYITLHDGHTAHEQRIEVANKTQRYENIAKEN